MKATRPNLLNALLDTPLTWGLVAFVVYFQYARYIATVAWNAIELIIAQHLLEHGSYATSLDYPSALTWRPVFPTLLVTLVRACTADPMLIYRIICGLSLGTLVAMMFLCGRLLGGRLAAHTAAFLTFTCPALTLYLVNHAHSYSHLGAMLVLGPALYFSLRVLQESAPGQTHAFALYGLCGLFWGLCYLSRSELQFFFGVLFAVLVWFHYTRKLSYLPLIALLLPFLALFFTYNFFAERSAQRDGLLSRKAIYGMYASQGWADPPPGVGGDIEAEGYLYAEKLYGDPLSNHESILTAIRHNPSAFLHRVKLNVHAFYQKYFDPEFFSPWCTIIDLVLLVALFSGRIPMADRRFLWFLFGLFLTTHFFLIFHIDPRYLSVNIPPLILLASYAIGAGFRLLGHRRLTQVVGLSALVVGGLIILGRPQFAALWNHAERNTQSQIAVKSLADHFHSVVSRPWLSGNRELHLDFVLSETTPIHPEDAFLLSYFTHSAWINGGADGVFPRGKIYCYRDTPDNYRYVPADKLQDPNVTRNGRIIADYVNPVLGRYYLLDLSH